MIVIYEVGDYANVEDNIEAGEMAAEDVRLVMKLPNNTWQVESCDSGSSGVVKEHWLSPK